MTELGLSAKEAKQIALDSDANLEAHSIIVFKKIRAASEAGAFGCTFPPFAKEMQERGSKAFERLCNMLENKGFIIDGGVIQWH